MLILRRRIGERLMIGDGIVVEVLAIRGRTIQLGIAAPRCVSVDRDEVRARKIQDREAGVMRQRDLLE